MIVHNLDVPCVATAPPKADTPLVIDPDAHLSCTIAFENFKSISRRDPQVLPSYRGVDLPELAKHPILNFLGKFAGRFTLPYPLRVLTFE